MVPMAFLNPNVVVDVTIVKNNSEAIEQRKERQQIR
jgi:hypothetical protein